jgi:hypothetical protein
LHIGSSPKPAAVGRLSCAAAILATICGLCAFSGQASAVTIAADDTVTVPGASFNPTPASSSGFSVLTASIPNVDLSPFAGTPQDGLAYSAVQMGGQALYNISGNSLSMFWGSPDTFNTIKFFAGPGETGGTVGTFTGSSLSAFPGFQFSNGHDLVTFAGTFGSVLFQSSGQAFEYTLAADPLATPLPAALPLYAAGIGVMGLLGRRRRRLQSARAEA